MPGQTIKIKAVHAERVEACSGSFQGLGKFHAFIAEQSA
jgi:hypothetical protein